MPVTYLAPCQSSLSLCIFQFFCRSKSAGLSACQTNCLSLSLPLFWFDRSASLSICISACLHCLKESENEVKLGEDVWRSRENVRCMTPALRFGWGLVSWPVYCLAFVYDISTNSQQRGKIPDWWPFLMPLWLLPVRGTLSVCCYHTGVSVVRGIWKYSYPSRLWLSFSLVCTFLAIKLHYSNALHKLLCCNISSKSSVLGKKTSLILFKTKLTIRKLTGYTSFCLSVAATSGQLQ